MNDQVKLSPHFTSVGLLQGSAESIAPKILSVTDGEGNPVQDGGTATNGHLSFVGSASPNQQAEIWDNGAPAYPPVNVDVEGHFSALLLDQKRGRHVYHVKTTDNQESPTWTVDVNVSETVSITWVTGPDGLVIKNGEFTFHDELNFTGTGTPDKVVELMNNGTVVKLLNVDSNGNWSANVKGLETGTQNFIARETNGQQSSPWRVLVKQPAPISIQFVLGNESFQLIGNQKTTTDTSVTLVGTANPRETGWIVDYERDLVPFAANDQGVYFATIKDLEEDHVHTFRLRSDLARISTPWAIRVVSSKLR
ncbi:hypothetical protein [Pseudomonas sp. AKS31]|jgi:hypothetical protein|uniref:hypothetical protein n=1 Tax=Pseudomonas sp. AKS31 TaxID=2949091 RepID=UPI00202A477B|nr:hypothetical protein [Pseudomonas sp. AKS31]MCL9800130.1 hypothetical protein [Pseudomonas sp. AKS31]